MDKVILDFINSQYRRQEYISCSLLRESSDNKVFLLDGKEKHIMRLSKKNILKDIEFEVDLLTFLNEKHFPSPKIVASDSGRNYLIYEGHVVIVTKFVNGKQIDFSREEKPEIEKIISASEALALLHEITSKMTVTSKKSRNINTELLRALDLKDLFINRFDQGDKFINEVEFYLSWAKEQQEKQIIIHNDFRPSNVLFNTSNDEVSAVIDYDWACAGPAIKDLAQACVEWSFPDGANEPWQDTFDLFLSTYLGVNEINNFSINNLHKWIAFSCLSDTATYFCDRLQDPGFTKNKIESYMYRKFNYYHINEE